MSKTHPYRIQLHCDRQMQTEIKGFAEARGLSHSAGARFLIERALTVRNDEISGRLDRIEALLGSVLHASSAARILAADAAKHSGSELSGDELRERIARLLERYRQFTA